MLSLHSHYKFPVSFCAAKLELDEANRVYLKSDLLVADRCSSYRLGAGGHGICSETSRAKATNGSREMKM